MKKIMYGLRKKDSDRLMSFYYNANNSYDSTDVSFYLTESGSIPWLVTSKEAAEEVAMKHTSWAYAYYESPGNSYVGQLEVVTVNMEIEIE